MRRLPPEPQVGDRITAELIRELIRCIRERQLIKGPNYALQTGPNGTVLKVAPPKAGGGGAKNKPLPFEVQWAAAESDGEGAWVIWLPDAGKLVKCGTEYLALTGVTASETLPAGWYTMDAVHADSDEVWLVVHIPESSGTAEAELAAAEGQTTTGEEVVNILVAKMETDDDTSAKKVTQLVDSAVVLAAPQEDLPEIPVPDGKSVGLNSQGKYEVKGWETPAPVEGGTIASKLLDTNPYDCHIIVRKPDGSIAYIPLGTLGLVNTTVSIVGDIMYDTNDHKIKKRIDTLNILTGAIVPGQYEMIEGGQAVGHSTTISE